MGYQKIAQRNPKTGVQKKSKNFYGEKVICKSRFLGQWGYPWEFFQNLHRHTPWQAEHSGFVKEYVCANFEKNPRGTLIDPKTLICI